MGVVETIDSDSGSGIGQPTTKNWEELIKLHSRGLKIIGDKPNLRGELEKFEFAGATLWSIHSEAQLMRRTRSNPSIFRPMAILHVSGDLAIIQGEEQCKLTDGSFVFIDGAIPHEIKATGEFRQLVLEFPVTCFRNYIYRRALGKGMTVSDPVNMPFYEGVKNLWAAAKHLDPRQHADALSALIALSRMTSVLNEAENRAEVPIRVHWAMEFIERNLSDFDLTAQTVADAQNVSRRYLDALFAPMNHRVQTWIWERRLVRAAEDLQLNTSPSHTILQTALDHGFKTPSHFSRAFSKRFDMSPREFRRIYSLRKPGEKTSRAPSRNN